MTMEFVVFFILDIEVAGYLSSSSMDTSSLITDKPFESDSTEF